MPSAATKRSAPTCQASAGQAAQPGEEGVGQHTQGHGPDAADAVAEPAEQDAAGRRPDQEAGCDDAEPQADDALVGRAEQVLDRRPADQREDAHLGAVEQPAQQCRRQRQPPAAPRPRLVVGAHHISIRAEPRTQRSGVSG
jgi:hypothetical protein